MLELSEFISPELDKNMWSFHFDLLRPDKFHEITRKKLPLNILQVLMDFISQRSFNVMLDGKKSGLKMLSVGWVQGFILDPRLFTFYLGGMQNQLPKNMNAVSYGDQMKSSKICKQNLHTVWQHDAYLKTVGVVSNINNTELIYFARKP